MKKSIVISLLLLAVSGCTAVKQNELNSTNRVNLLESDSSEKTDLDETLSKEQVKQIAIDYYSLNQDDVKFVQIELENENGNLVYEIEIKAGSMEYDLELDASTGKVLKSETEVYD